jgi:hypothetical protein
MAPVWQDAGSPGARQTGDVLTRDLALALRAAGLVWHPAPGDAFVVPDRDLDDELFVLSEMVIQSVDVPDGPPILAFNGTTEWALDSLEADEAVWVPHEHQLRQLLGDAFMALEALPGEQPGYAVVLDIPTGPERYVDVSAEAAYARALLAALTRRRPPRAGTP